MPDTKIVGYTLLIIGILVILFPAISVYQVFTKKADPIQLFTFNAISLDLSTSLPIPNAKPTEILPAEVLNQTSNVFAHLFLMGFITSVGYKLAGLGVMLLRPVEVKVKTKEVPVPNQ